MVEVEVPLKVANHLVTVGTLLLQWLAQVNSLHVQSEVATAVGLVVALITPVVEDLLVHGVDVLVEQLLPLELFAADSALETVPGPLVFWPVALSVLEMSPQVLGPLATVRAGPDILLGVNPADVAVECALAGGGVAAVRAGQGLVTQGAGLHVRGEILV